jgi:hypothetical protein
MRVLCVRYSEVMSGSTEQMDMERADLLHMAALRREGLLASKPAQIACFIEAPTLQAARQSAREARACGWDVAVHLSCDEQSWMMHATRIMRIDWETVVNMRTTMVAIANRAGGEYDGWGVSPI